MSKQQKGSSLTAGRPPLAEGRVRSLPSKATRTIIRSHHNLHKQLNQAIKTGDTSKAEAIKREIEERGGLEKYQQASINGQSRDRGGDSSKILMKWLGDLQFKSDSCSGQGMPRLLEVGALSTTNACSKSGVFEVTHIDLNSQDPKIEQQDFMARPLPVSDAQRFDGISLSLVLNYVSDAEGRGDMLRRTREFQRASLSDIVPFLFLVLPAPCITNSRYMDEGRLDEIMISLGYIKLKQKLSPKLVYSLWRLDPSPCAKEMTFSKVEVKPGRTRNNFSIILR